MAEVAQTLEPGQLLIDRYRIEGELGRGGLGVVYAATQLNIQRKVALKVLLPHLTSEESSLDRFAREARLARQLEHPNTVRLYDIFPIGDQQLCLAWEYLEGKPLRETIDDEGGIAAIRVQRIAEQILKSLLEAHQKGIIHRDIKPSNVMLCRFAGEPDYVKVLDFGVAKSQKLEEDTGRVLTQHGEILGTPQYMSPEQVHSIDVVPASDLYSLGLVMAEALTSRPVYDGPSPIAVCFMHVDKDPTPIPDSVKASPLGDIIVKATNKDRTQRWQSAADMLGALRALSRDDLIAWGRNSIDPDAAMGAASPSSQSVALSQTYAEDMLAAPEDVEASSSSLPKPAPAQSSRFPTHQEPAPGPPPGPPMVEPSMHPDKRPRSKMPLIVGGIALVLVVLALVVGAAVFGAGATAWFLVADGEGGAGNKEVEVTTDEDDEPEDEDKDQGSDERKTKKTKKTKKPTRKPAKKTGVAALDPASMPDRLDRLGWNVTANNTSDNTSSKSWSWTAQKGEEYVWATVILIELPKADFVERVADSYREQAAAVRTGDKRILAIYMSPPAFKSDGKKLMNDLIE